MFNKKFLLVVWYVLGWFVTSLYNKKKPWELEHELKKSKETWNSELIVLVNNFIDTHKNMIDSLKKEPFYQKNKELINEKKEEFLKIANEYKLEWQKLLEELKLKGKDYVWEACKKLEELYELKKGELETLKDEAPEKIIELKEKLLASYEETKKKIKEKMNEEEKK